MTHSISDNSQNAPISIASIEPTLLSILDRLKSLSEAQFPPSPSKYSVSDCRIETEEYIEESIAQHIESRVEWSNAVDKMSLKARKDCLIASPTTNALLSQAKQNVHSIRAASLAAILKTRNARLTCKDALAKGDLRKFIEFSRAPSARRKQRNALPSKSIPLLRIGDKNAVFLRIAAHSSLNAKKISEFYARADCALSEVADAIGCTVRAMDFRAHNRFFFFEKLFAVERVDGGVEVGEREIAEKCARDALGISVVSMAETRLDGLDLAFGKRYIYRDHVNCDHEIVVCEAALCDFGARRVVHAFAAARRRSDCECCGAPADNLLRDSPLSHSNNAFLCERCFGDICVDENGGIKVENASIYRYFGTE